MSSYDRNCHFQAEFVATKPVAPHTLFQQHGRVYQVMGTDRMMTDELVIGRSDRRSEIDKGNPADVFAQDADVFYGTDGNAYLDLAAATAASDAFNPGDEGFKAGKASKVSGSTANTVMVNLNF